VKIGKNRPFLGYFGVNLGFLAPFLGKIEGFQANSSKLWAK